MSLLVVMTRAPEAETTLRRTLSVDNRVTGIETCRSLEELNTIVARDAPALAFVDVADAPIDGLRSLESVVRKHRDTNFVAICDSLESRVVLEAMQIGARSCIERGRIGDEILGTLDRLMVDQPGDPGGGRIVTIVGAKGGAGATSLSLQFAEELRGDGEALLVDLDESTGGLSHSLGLQGSFGVADVLGRGGAIDPELVRSTSQEAGESLYALMSPVCTGSGEAEPLALDTLEPCLSSCREAFPITVVDAARVPARALTTLARHSDAIMLVFQLSVVDLKAASLVQTMLENSQVAIERIHPLANRYRKRGSILTLADAREALGASNVEAISNDYESMTKSLDLGRPLSIVSPRSAIRKDVRSLVARMGIALPSTEVLR